MLGLFVAALFLSATLLFWVQPMVAKMLLPLLGGTPTVWNTCMVFFQAMLLAGYAYAHWLTTRVGPRKQVLIHAVLLLVALTILPIGLSSSTAQSAPWQSNPTWWLLRALVLIVALPFFVLSASAPLLQSWFSQVRHRSSKDPYFLYAASNFGSFVGLIAYPAIVEPGFPLSVQSRIWAAGYGILILLFLATSVVLWRNGRGRIDPIESAPPADIAARPGKSVDENQVSWSQRLQWVFWAFVPSSLMLGVTTYLSTDIASVPLLWVVPLGIYLITFVLVFSRRQIIPQTLIVRVLPGLAVVLVFVMLNNADNLAWLQMSLHLLFLFVAAMAWHGRLANDRPSHRALTQFYFCMSVGGVLGGVFNALVAPVVFRTVVEYRIAIALACLLWPVKGGTLFRGRAFWRDAVVPLVIWLLTTGLAVWAPQWGLGLQMSMMIVFGVPLILCYVISKWGRPFEFMLAITAVLAGSAFYTGFHGRTLHVERNFFGTLRYAVGPGKRFHRLYHGTTVHGMEHVAPERRGEPLAYYHRNGPCGQAMTVFNSSARGTNVAVIGLGAGSMAAYAQSGQHWTFYEINPAVIRLASDTNFFVFLNQCAAPVDLKVGDARLRLREAPAHQFDLLVCDAFGSDAPPLHLLNREALELYLSKLAPDGLLLLHISSRYLNFRPVIGNLAEYFHLVAVVNTDDAPATDDGKLPSSWVALARTSEQLGALRNDPLWQPLSSEPGMRLWTDDYSNILSVFDWR